jgi:UDP-N-acetylmuramate--alanine ligase
MKTIHFIGISGIGMSAVALIAMEAGIRVTGSADEENDRTADLQRRGISFYLGHRPENIGNPDAVVRSAAVPDTNPEVRAAKTRNIPIYLYSQYLGMLMAERQGIAVAGTHGKTSTTAMLAKILSDAGLEPAVVCGGVMRGFASNALTGSGDYFIAEACEYNRSFLDLQKRFSIVTNIEPDHLDYYRDIQDIRGAFRDFLRKADGKGFSVVNGDDYNVRDIITGPDIGDSCITVGEGAQNRYRVSCVSKNGGYSLGISEKGKPVLSVDLPIPGRFSCLNGAFAAVCSLCMGIDADRISHSLETFRGIERRLELLGHVSGCPVYSDYAHHPTEIRVTIETAREVYPSKEIIVVFQPHQYARTRLLFDGFIDSLLTADGVLLSNIYRQRDSERYVRSVSSKKLFAALQKRDGKPIWYVKEKRDIPCFLDEMGCTDAVIIFMGAGDIDVVARDYVRLFS